MQDIITAIVAQQLAEILIALAIAALGGAGTFAMAQLTRLLGEKRMKLLNDKLGDAIERGLADAASKGLTGEAAKAWAEDYIRQTLSGAVRKLNATDADLAKRVSAQAAQASALEKGIAIGKAIKDAR